jgi:hypothetical protein
MESFSDYMNAAMPAARDRSKWIKSFYSTAPRESHSSSIRLYAKSGRILRYAQKILTQIDFRGGGHELDFSTGLLELWFEKEFDRNEDFLVKIDGLTSERIKLRLDVTIKVNEDGIATIATSRQLPDFRKAFMDELRAQFGDPTSQPKGVITNPTRSPGDPVDRAWVGTLLDYSACAKLDELDELVHRPGDKKALPLGFYRFDPDPKLPQGSLLSLGAYQSRAPMEYNGVLIVAPQNSGKTELIVRWALAANQAGYNVLLVDVKGNLLPRLKKEGLRGHVWHYTTDPEPDVEAHSLNLLDELSCITAVGRHRLGQLIDVLIRVDEHDGKNQDFWINQKRILEGFITLLKLREYLDRTKPADLGEVYKLAMDENELVSCILEVRTTLIGKVAARQAPDEIDMDFLRFVVLQLASVISLNDNRLPNDLPPGQREERFSYQSVTMGVAMTLAPFNRYGTLYRRSFGRGDFNLRDIDGEEQTTIVLAAREQDGEIAKTVLTAAVKRLEQILYDRRKNENPSRRILLLLDETRRIKGFDPADFITFARDAKAGCVLVYQSLSQIKDENDRTIILENIGTQIYLRSLSGKTADAFVELLPKRTRPSYSITEVGEGESTSVQTGLQEVPFIGHQELYKLPAGPHPALVFIKETKMGKPFLVNMDRELIREELDKLRKVSRDDKNRTSVT